MDDWSGYGETLAAVDATFSSSPAPSEAWKKWCARREYRGGN